MSKKEAELCSYFNNTSEGSELPTSLPVFLNNNKAGAVTISSSWDLSVPFQKLRG